MAKANDAGSAFGGVPLLVGAVGFGLVAALLAFVYLKSREAALEEKYRDDSKIVSVIVARDDIRRGSQIRKEQFAFRKIPAKFVHGDALTSVDQLDDYVGQALTADVGRGKPLLRTFIDREFPVDFSDTIPVERRAFTIQVDEVSSIAGFIRPGNYVDLFVNIAFTTSGFDSSIITAGFTQSIPDELKTLLPPVLVEAIDSAGPNVDEDTAQALAQLADTTTPRDVIMPVLQNVRVLATGRDPYRENLDALRYPQGRSERNFSTITLDVTPEQAALLAIAEDDGDLIALLRNRDDQSTAKFTAISSNDIFDNATEMQLAEDARRSRVGVASGVDALGNLVDADGNVLLSNEQLKAAGLTVDANGNLVDKDGNIVDPNDLVVTADGRVMSKSALEAAGYTVNEAGQIIDANGNVVDAADLVMTKDGQILHADELAAAGLSVNENGEIVDENGRVYSADDLVKTADGKILTKSQLEAAGLSVNENGEVVDANGNVVDTSELDLKPGEKVVTTADGRVFSASQLEAAGLSINENGEIVDADGNVVNPDDLVAVNGNVLTKDQLAAAGLRVNENGEFVDANGNVVDVSNLDLQAGDQVVATADGRVFSSSQLEAAGLSINENGEIVDADGNVIDPNDLVAVDGQLMTREQLAEAGLSINENGEIVDANGNVVDPNEVKVVNGKVVTAKQLAEAGLAINADGEIVDANGNPVELDSLIVSPDGTVSVGGRAVDLIIGGDSKDGVAKSVELEVTE